MNRTSNNACTRRGAASVETAILLPLLVLLVIGLLFFQVGVFRKNQIAWLAQESSRYASVHGKEFSEQSGLPIASEEDLMLNIIRPNAFGLDPQKLTLSLEWREDFRFVTVSIEYPWNFFIADRVLKCVSNHLVTY